MKTYDLSKYRFIEPDAVTHFLLGQGWEEFNKKDGIVSIWGIEKAGDIFKILLPLNPESPDYPNRMLEAVKIIGLVESREESDLLKSFLNNSIFARESNRELMDLRLLPELESVEKNEFPAKMLGYILSSLQNLIDAIGQAEEGYRSSITGVISKTITDRTRLSVIGTAPGSFIVKLAGPTAPTQTNLFDEVDGSLEQRALNSFLTLIRVSHEGKMDDLRELLIKLERRTVVTYKKFLSNVSSANSGFDIKLGSTNPNIGGEARLNSSEILGLIDFLSRIESQTPEIIKVDGTLKLVGEKDSKNNFTFKMERLGDGKIFHGKIASSVIENGVELTLNRKYSAFIEETESINVITNESVKNWKLVDIHYLEETSRSEDNILSDIPH
ncbi:hypothetical protein RIF25_04860 [Thermosynechococcaceae cyanobacterium BACA0444]|uniref:Uncharacterized protein n=1 Tax=Pseudocalidococcus azoricus BACA0444 TaxID=2918990 RepID=A0AAE4FQ63_9CYAN|nr:hypothetical protein [Pseudocalidococcus azoricus]MDS3860131.1 hypothetical protein [Pseudocalidococcus azoricus BACA0444]